MRYRVHQFKLSMTSDQRELEHFLNSLSGDVIAIIPNILGIPVAHVDMVLIIERIDQAWQPPGDGGEKIPEDIAVP